MSKCLLLENIAEDRNLDMVDQKLGQILGNPFVHLKGTILIQFIWNYVKMFIFIKSRPCLKQGHAGLKNRSVGQILEKTKCTL